jgi:pilus assembly protein CpaC
MLGILLTVGLFALPPARAQDVPSGRELPPGVKPPVGTTPRPSREVRDQFRKHVGARVDPAAVMDLRAGRPRLLRLNEAPFRIQVGDGRVLRYAVLGKSARDLSLQGRRVGTTVLNLWFGDRDDPSKQTVLSYLVRVY